MTSKKKKTKESHLLLHKLTKINPPIAKEGDAETEPLDQRPGGHALGYLKWMESLSPEARAAYESLEDFEI